MATGTVYKGFINQVKMGANDTATMAPNEE